MLGWLLEKYRLAKSRTRIERLEVEALEDVFKGQLREWRSSSLDSWDDDEDSDDWRGSGSRSKGAFSGRFRTLDEARQKHRELVRNDTTARGILRSLLRYCLRRPGVTLKLDLVKELERDGRLTQKRAHAVLDFWTRASAGRCSRYDGTGPKERWRPRLREAFWRVLRDGEVLLRFFDRGRDEFHWRFVDPEKIAKVVTPPNDAECVLGFELKRGLGAETEFLDGSDCVWWKIGTDGNEKRGLPYLFAVATDVKRYGQWINDLGLLMHIRTAIALIREHPGSSPAQVRAFADTRKTGSTGVTDQGTRRELRQNKIRGGTTIDVNAGTKYTYLEPKIDITKLSGYGRELGLRCVQGTGLAEYIVRGDAQAMNYASAKITEGPTAMEIEYWQDEIIECLVIPAFLRAIEWGGRWGLLPGRSEEMAERVVASAPNFPRREREKEVVADTELVSAGAMSRRTLAARDGLDPDEEIRQIAEEEAREVYPDRSDDKDDPDGGDDEGAPRSDGKPGQNDTTPQDGP